MRDLVARFVAFAMGLWSPLIWDFSRLCYEIFGLFSPVGMVPSTTPTLCTFRYVGSCLLPLCWTLVAWVGCLHYVGPMPHLFASAIGSWLPPMSAILAAACSTWELCLLLRCFCYMKPGYLSYFGPLSSQWVSPATLDLHCLSWLFPILGTFVASISRLALCGTLVAAVLRGIYAAPQLPTNGWGPTPAFSKAQDSEVHWVVSKPLRIKQLLEHMLTTNPHRSRR